MIQLSQWGILILNLGTPKSPAVKDVRRYLVEFLMDPFVVDIPAPLRFLFVHGLISPLRSPRSAEAYSKIWTTQGSPLDVETRKLAAELSERFPVSVAYRYGDHSIAKALKELKAQKVDRILVYPLYPQYAESSTLTVFEALKEALKKNPFRGVRLIQDYHREEYYLEALIESVRQYSELLRRGHKPDVIMLSYHGLPIRHLTKASPRCESCVQNPTCESLNFELCYRGQCYVTSRLLEKRLRAAFPQWSDVPVQVSFQSRLGRTPWIKPVTEEVLLENAKLGRKKVLMMAPGFAVDCLETLEELDMGLREKFASQDGEILDRIPCLNSEKFWSERLKGHLYGQIEEQLVIEREELEYAQTQRASPSKSTH